MVPRLQSVPAGMSAEESSPTSTRPRKVEDEVETAIRSIRLRRQDQNKQFVCGYKLGEVWSDHGRLDRLLESYLSPEELDFVRRNLIKILSTLVWIRWSRWADFKKIFMDHRGKDGARDRLDQNLPIESVYQLEDESFFSITQFASRFATDQYIFTPISIEQDQHQEYPKIRRLPFVDEPEEIRHGSYGRVTKEVIAVRHFNSSVDSQRLPNQEEKVIARKCMSTKDDFEKEVNTLNILRESLSSHAHIMTHIGTLIHGDDFNIFFPWAEMDLSQLIRGQHPEGVLVKTPINLIKEFSNLADALKFLHNDIILSEGRRVFVVHMDISPSNIVIRFHPKSAVGIWMITDFGISVVKMQTQGRPHLAAITDFDPSPTRTVPKRFPGPFQAPEIHERTTPLVGRKSDIWSFGCVLSLVLALALGGPTLVGKLNEARIRDGDAHYKTDYFYREIESSLVTRRSSKWEVNQHVLSWLEALPNTFDKQRTWVRDCTCLIKRMIVIDAKQRPDAGTVYADLYDILEKVRGTNEILRPVLGATASAPIPSLVGFCDGAADSDSMVIFPISYTNSGALQQPVERSDTHSTPNSVFGPLKSSLVKLQLPSVKILQTCFSPSGGLIAFLSDTHVFVYTVEAIDEKCVWKKEIDSAVSSEVLPAYNIHDPKQSWKSMSLSDFHLLLRGGPQGVTLYELRSTISPESIQIMIEDYPNLSGLLKSKLSSRGDILFMFTDRIEVWRQKTDESGSQSRVKSLSMTGTLKTACFSSDGLLIYAWTSADQWYIWDTHTDTPNNVCNGSYPTDRSGRQFQVLIPISDPNAFIICENHYKVSIVQKGLSTSQPACSSKPLNGLNTAIYDAKHDCLVSIQTSNRSWFRVRNQHRIMVHRLLRAHDGSIYFRAGSGVPIGESAHQMKYKAPVRVAIEQVEYSASLSLLIAHPDGVLERLKE